jgi:hypothetical protein
MCGKVSVQLSIGNPETHDATPTHWAPAIVASHLGVQSGFVNEYQPADIPVGLLRPPPSAGGLDVRSILLGGARRFFIAQPQLLQAVPQGGDAEGDVELLPTPLLQLHQRQVRLLGNPTAQGPVMLLQTGAPVAADLFGLASAGQAVLLPKTLDASAADPEAPAYLAGSLSAFTCGDDSKAQVLA